MDKKKLYNYLLVTEKTSEVYPLYEILGLDYLEIKKIYNFCLQEGYILKRDREIFLTEDGKKKIVFLRKHMGVKGNENFIIPYEAQRFSNLPINTIILDQK